MSQEVSAEQAKSHFLAHEAGALAKFYAERIAQLEIQHLAEKQALRSQVESLTNQVESLSSQLHSE